MIAIDTSSFIAYLSGESGGDVEAVELALADRQAVLPPVVLTELLSEPNLPKSTKDVLKELPTLEIEEGYWERAGALRAHIISKKLKARLADALITQSCIDHRVPLITRDKDFRHFARRCGLKLIS